MIFKYNSTLDINLIQKLTKIKKLEILDFGCGIGTWDQENLKNRKIKKVTLYDKNKRLIKILKKKYKGNKIEINFNFKKVLKRKYNLIIIASVIQYMNLKNVKKLLTILSKNREKKDLYIIIADLPRFSRFIEFFLMPFFNYKRFLFVIKMLFSKEYKKLNFYIHNKKDFYFLDKIFSIKCTQNIHDLKYLRYSILLRSK